MPSSGSRTTLPGWADWLFRDRRNGRITIAQFPNLSLGVFLASIVAAWFVDDGSAPSTVLRWIGTLALLWWAGDEIVRGVNPWRRMLGLAGLVFVVLRLVSLLG